MAAIRGLISSVARGAGRFDEGQRGRRPSLSFHSKCQTAARVRSFSRRDCVRGLPTTFVTTGLDPVVHADCGSERPNRLVRSSLSSAWIAGSSPAMTTKKKGGEAPKDACHPVSAPFLPKGRGCGSDPSQTSLRSLRNLSACGDRSPSGAPLRRLPRRANARTQPRPRFTRNTMRRRYLRLESRLSEAPRAPVVMPAGTMPGPPGSGVTSPARRNRTCSINWLSPVDVPDVSETARLWSSRRGSQRPCICADESGPFTHRGFRQLARTTLDSFPILIVMAGLVPAIHVLLPRSKRRGCPA